MSQPESIDPSAVPQAAGPAQSPTLWQLLAVFSQIGATSFGGGITSWTMRIVVDERGWMSMDDFLAGLAMCQALPGVNVLNLAVWIGYRVGGAPGAFVCCFGILAPAAVIIAVIAMLFAALGDGVLARLAFAGATAAAIGLSLSVGAQAVRHSVRAVIPAVIVALTVLAVGVFKISIVPVVLVLGPLGVAVEMWKGRRRGA